MSGGSGLIELMRKQAKLLMPIGIELATVIAPPPNLVIRINNMDINLEGDDLIVCQHLLNYERVVTLEHMENVSRDLGNGTGKDMVSGDGQIFTVNDDGQAPYSSFTYDNIRLSFNDVLKAGDRVAVQALPGGQKYLVIDKVVEMGG